MSRLADYFVVVGFDHDKERSGLSSGKILQRFPEKDWPDCPFTAGIDLFCQPTGWKLSTVKKEPTFFVSVLTDVEADRHYCACLTFSEDVSATIQKIDEEDDIEYSDPSMVRSSQLFAPKCLLLVSKLYAIETLRNCLGCIYSVYIESMSIELETLIGNILGCIQVPPPGGPQIRFSIGAGDRQALQPPLSSNIPVSGNSVVLLFQELGISNALSLFCAALTDHKVLFHSQSYCRLTAASHAITSLMYPLRYSYVYIPLLPAGLIEVLNTPTPFIAGVHTSLRPEYSDLLDVIVADLDGGSIYVPEQITIPSMPEPLHSRVVHSLNLLLNSELQSADNAFFQPPPKASPHELLDKEVRAVFLRFFAELFFGYRSCLTVNRIHPEPFISFHKANFLGHRGLVEDEFTARVVDSMSFGSFVSERGPPYRVTDIFDEVFAAMQETLKVEEETPRRLLHNIKDLGNLLYQNENPNPQPYAQKIIKPVEGAHTRVHQPVFPHINSARVAEIIEEGLAKQSLKAKPPQPRIVPVGPNIHTASERQSIISNNMRRLEVLRSCVTFIFENKISDAKKIFPAVLRALKGRIARKALVEELAFHVQSNRSMLEHQQFDLVVKLLNHALQNDSSMDENGIAAAILPLSSAFCRKLSTGIIQFAYTCVQEHAVWQNQQFWEATFYQDVQKQIRQLYAPQYEETWRSSTTPDAKRRSSSQLPMMRAKEIGALEIAAEQMRIWPTLSKEEQDTHISHEESIVYSQAIHYANQMVYLRVPLDASKSMEFNHHAEKESASSNITNSVAESDSFDAESGFEEQEISEVCANVTKFVTRFIDKVCCESSVTPEHIKSLHQMIPGVVSMHMEILDGVFKESKRLPPIQKPKLLSPTLLPGEDIVMEGLRVYLVPDGREEGCGGNMGGPPLLPAEGAVFLTTYRVIFKGTPLDPLACEHIVCRSFPVSSLTKEKKISVTSQSYIDQSVQEGLQIRSNTFQMLKIMFDEEVNVDDIEAFRKLMIKVRYPTSVINTFAFTGYMYISQPSQLSKNKEKNASLKGTSGAKSKTLTSLSDYKPSPEWGFAKRTLMKTARKAGIKTKSSSSSKPKYALTSPGMSRRHLGDTSNHGVNFDDDLSVIEEHDIASAIHSDAKNIDKLAQRAVCQDYERLGLGSLANTNVRSRAEPWKLTMVNSMYQVCKSYPAVLVVPQTISDDSIRKFSKSHRQCRFPVLTWRHPKTKAVLLRASGFHGKGVMGMLKTHHHNTPSGSTAAGHQETTSTSVEQEKYFQSVVAATPMALSRGGSGKSRPHTTYGTLTQKQANGTMEMGGIGDTMTHGFQKAALYVLGEKTQMKGIKVDSFPKCDFIPVEYQEVRHVKSCFKKMMRACCPSAPFGDVDKNKGFYRAVQDSEWLSMLHNILQIAGAAVDLIDVQGSSVMVCLEDGWDFTTQVVSIAQILLDPYYRTMEGLKALIEKEWLSFGHRFTHRSNHTTTNQASGFAPVFLQFLDVIHQIMHQFPLSFEYNQFFLKFLAYHYVSNRFRTFMLDCEFERVEAGWMLDDAAKSKSLERNEGAFSRRLSAVGHSIWDYLDRYHKNSPVFFNFQFSPNDQDTVLRPYSNISNLQIWDYYLEEDLSHGPSYDFEVVMKEQSQEEDEEMIENMNMAPMRKIVNGCYHNVIMIQPDVFTYFFTEIGRSELELGDEENTTEWLKLWENLEQPVKEQLQRHSSFNTQAVRLHGRSTHKRSTVELLVKGKLWGEDAKMFSQPHRFEKYTYTTPGYCDYCSHVLWGMVSTGMRCIECGYNCHEKCMSYVAKNCTKLRPVSEASIGSTSISKVSIAETASVSGEHRTYEGYLYKRGALLKGWKQRFFVLDSMKHQLRYYDNAEDQHCKGYIDLQEVVSVAPLKNVQGAPKKSDEKAVFEMKTVRRVYNFLAEDAQKASDWIEHIQRLQET